MNNTYFDKMFEVFDKINDLFGQLDTGVKKAVLCMLIDDITINNNITARELFNELLPVIENVNDEIGDLGIRREN